MTLYDNYKRKLELINKIQDLHLRKKCLKHFLLEFSNSNNNFDADKVIRTANAYIENTQEEIDKSNNQEENVYRVITPDVIYRLSDHIITKAIKIISEIEDPRIRKKEYDVLLPFYEDEALALSLKRRINDVERDIRIKEELKTKKLSDYHYKVVDDTFSDKDFISNIELAFDTFKHAENQNKIKFYNPKLFYILNIPNPINVVNTDNFDEVCSIGTSPYLEAYTAEYNKGIADFDRDFSHLQNTYHTNPAMVINTLKSKFYPQIWNSNVHWSKVYNFNDCLSLESVKEIGYKSGLVSRMWNLINSLNIDKTVFESPFNLPIDTVDDKEALRIFLSIIDSDDDFTIRFDKLKKELKKSNTDIKDGISILNHHLGKLKKERDNAEIEHNKNNPSVDFKFQPWVNHPRNIKVFFKDEYFDVLSQLLSQCDKKINNNIQVQKPTTIIENQNEKLTCSYAHDLIENFFQCIDYSKKHKSDWTITDYNNSLNKNLSDLKDNLDVFFVDFNQVKTKKCIETCIRKINKLNGSFSHFNPSQANDILAKANIPISQYVNVLGYDEEPIDEYQELMQFSFEDMEAKNLEEYCFEIHKSFFALICNNFTTELVDYLNSKISNNSIESNNIIPNTAPIDNSNFIYSDIDNLLRDFVILADCTLNYKLSTFEYKQNLTEKYNQIKDKATLLFDTYSDKQKSYATYFLSVIKKIKYKGSYFQPDIASNILKENNITLNQFFLPPFDDNVHISPLQNYLYQNLSFFYEMRYDPSDDGEILISTHKSFISLLSEIYINELKSFFNKYVSMDDSIISVQNDKKVDSNTIISNVKKTVNNNKNKVIKTTSFSKKENIKDSALEYYITEGLKALDYDSDNLAITSLINILKSKDFTKLKKFEILGETNLFCYFISLLESDFEKLKPKVIGDSMLFKTSNGIHLTQSNYSKSKKEIITSLKKRNIDIIFKNYSKKKLITIESKTV